MCPYMRVCESLRLARALCQAQNRLRGRSAAGQRPDVERQQAAALLERFLEAQRVVAHLMEISDPSPDEGFLIGKAHVEENPLHDLDTLFIDSAYHRGDFRGDAGPVPDGGIPPWAIPGLRDPHIDQRLKFSHSIVAWVAQRSLEGLRVGALPVGQQLIEQLLAAVEEPVEATAGDLEAASELADLDGADAFADQGFPRRKDPGVATQRQLAAVHSFEHGNMLAGAGVSMLQGWHVP